MKKPLRPCETGYRRCLKCTKNFLSRGAGNRICSKCSQVNAALRVSEGQLARERGAKRHNGELIDRRDTYDMNFFNLKTLQQN